MIIASLKVKVAPEKHHDAIKTVRPILGPTRVKPGCLSIVFCQQVDDPETMILIERWNTRKDFEDHIRSDEYRHILALIDLSAEPPEIQLNTISQTDGLKAIEAIRAKPLS